MPTEFRTTLSHGPRTLLPDAHHPSGQAPHLLARHASSPSQSCSLCQSSERPLVHARPLRSHDEVRVLAHQHPLLRLEAKTRAQAEGLHASQEGFGAHEVISESLQHDLTLETLSLEHLTEVLLCWRDRARDLLRDRRLHVVQIQRLEPSAFSLNSHPYSELLASQLPGHPLVSALLNARRHYAEHHRCVTCDLIHQEQTGPRALLEDAHLFSTCEYASPHPFAIHLYPKAHEAQFSTLTHLQAHALAEHLQRLWQALRELLGDVALSLSATLSVSSEGAGLLPEELRGLEHYWHWRLELIPQHQALLPTPPWHLAHHNTRPEEAARLIREVISRQR